MSSHRIERLFAGFRMRYGALELRDGQSMKAIVHSWAKPVGTFSQENLESASRQWFATNKRAKSPWPEEGEFLELLRSMGFKPAAADPDRTPLSWKEANRDAVAWFESEVVRACPEGWGVFTVEDCLQDFIRPEHREDWKLSFAERLTRNWLNGRIQTLFEAYKAEWIALARQKQSEWRAAKMTRIGVRKHDAPAEGSLMGERRQQGASHIHHFMPVFYTSRWSDRVTGKLVEFSEPYPGKVVGKPVGPKATGFLDRLNVLEDLPADDKEQLEEAFFSPLDNKAALVLNRVEAGWGNGDQSEWTAEDRTAWSRFVMSMMFRNPEELEAAKAMFAEDWRTVTPEVRRAFEEAGDFPGKPATVEEFLQAQPDTSVRSDALRIMRRSMLDNRAVGQRLNDARWRFLELPKSDLELLTSDRPVMSTNGLGRDRAYLTMPVGPRRLFVASQSAEVLDRVCGTKQTELVRRTNKTTVTAACRYVYGSDKSQAEFVRRNFGKSPAPLWASRMRAYRQHAEARGLLPSQQS